FDDWIGELNGAFDPDESVSKRLARVAKGHDPVNYSMQEITISGPEVSIVYDTGEDAFRDGAGDFAALFRGAASHGAKGTLWFLGTAGAEGDFVYELSLDGKGTNLRKLKRKETAPIYDGEGYRAFMDRLMEMFEAANPAVRKMMTKQREGDRPTKKGAG